MYHADNMDRLEKFLVIYKDQVLTTDSSVQVMATSIALVVWSPATVTSSLVIATIISSTTMEVE